MPRNVERRSRQRPSFWLWLLPLILGGMVLGVFGVRTYMRAHPQPTMPERVRDLAQGFVRERFGPDVIATFAPPEWTTVSRDGEEYLVSGWVEAAPKSGLRAITYDYSCTVARNADGDWYLAKYEMMSQ